SELKNGKALTESEIIASSGVGNLKGTKGVAGPKRTKDILNGGLDVHESMGGHLLKKHVGKSEQELLERLKNQPNISGSSSFSNENIAEDVCYKILCDKNNKVKINEWLSDSKKGNKLVLDYKGIEEDFIGIGVKRGESSAKDMYNGMIVLKKDGKGGYYILTGYPTK
ncbi:RNase A-like domain-containing protein, partial [Clostridium butyricum]